MTGSGADDEVTSAILSESAYERLRYTQPRMFTQSIPRKLMWGAYLLVGVATVLPIMAAFPVEMQALLPDGGVAFGSPRLILLGLVAAAAVFLGGATLAVVGMLRVRLEGRMTEAQADTLLNVEEVASLLGLGTGGVGVLLTLCYVALGLLGVETVRAYIRTVGQDPFAPSGVGLVSVSAVATLAFVGSVALLVASQFLHFEYYLRVEGYGLKRDR